MASVDDFWNSFTEDEKKHILGQYATRPADNGNGDGAAAQFSTWGDIAKTLGPITWVWPDWLPAGMLTIVAAEPGVGKSALCLRIAATMIGDMELWPDGAAYAGERGRVVWAEAESGQAINLERARGWGLSLDRLIQPGLPLEDFRLDDQTKLDALIDLAFEPDVNAIIIDSLRGANSRNENDSDVIALVMRLAELARDANKPVILTHHLRKRNILDGPEGPSLDRLRGSSAIVQPARVVWTLDTPDPYDKETRRLAQAKNNLARNPEPIGFTIGAGGVAFGDAPEAPRVISRLDAAKTFLMTILQDEPLPADEVFEQAGLAGHSSPTVKKAKESLGIVSLKKATKGQHGGGQWVWSLPPKD
jgi:putative DNA primase/helicase